jgi:hypothetical protein
LRENHAGAAAMEEEESSDSGKRSDQQADRDRNPEKANPGNKRQSGRPPMRPPYEQYRRVNGNLK